MQNGLREFTNLKDNFMAFLYLPWLLLIYVLILPPSFGIAQNKTFSRDSLLKKDDSIVKKGQHILQQIVKGIAAGDFKKPGWNEYTARDNLNIDRVFIRNQQDHPRLISKRQLEIARTRINLPPYNLWYQKLKHAADSYDVNNEPEHPVDRADNLKILAFVYYLEKDEHYLQKIERILEKFPAPPGSFTYAVPGKDWGDNLEAAQTISALCVGLDLVYNDLPADLRESILYKIGPVINQLSDAIPITPSNNHMAVISMSFMQTAMLLEHPEKYTKLNRQRLWQTGLRNLARALGRVAPDGGYAEGTYYAGFVLSYLSPFVVYFKNMTGVNLINNPTLEKLIQWYMVNDKGSGSYTLFDDGLEVNWFFLPILSTYSKNHRSIDLFWHSQPPAGNVDINMIEAMCVYNNQAFSEFDAPSAIQFYPDMGQAVFKDDWLKPEVFGSFLGENERWFADKHEDIDPLSFEISAYGEDLIVDAGYGQWTTDFYRTLWYKSPYAHNGILVDGMGTYRNPIWGDPIGCSFEHAFQTKDNAAVTLQTKICDVKISRKVYYLQNRFFLILDDFITAARHTISTNFNYTGRMQQLNENNIRVTKNEVNLDFLQLSTSPAPFVLKQNYGLRTVRGPSEETASFQMEQNLNKPELFATLIYPSTEEHPVFFLKKNPVIGNGTYYVIPSTKPGMGESEMVVNRCENISAAEWQTNARFFYGEKNANDQLKALLLVNFTHFKYQSFEISCDQPLSIFLERNGTQWLGYVEVPQADLKYTVYFKHFSLYPLRFNHRLIQVNSTTNQEFEYNVLLQGSGSLEMGTGDAFVKVPYPDHSNIQFLAWLAARYHSEKNYDNWSDYDKQQLNNDIVSGLLWGAEKGAEHWSTKLFGDEKVLTQATNALGQSQETISDRTFSTFDIAHRYQFAGEISQNKWNFVEDGTFTERGILFRNMRLQTRNASGAGLEYRFYHFFKDHQAHSLKLQVNDNNFMNYQTAYSNNKNVQQLEFYLSDTQGFLHPGYSWSPNTSYNEQFVNAGIKNYRGSFWRRQDADNKSYYESLSNYSDSWSYSLEGTQDNQNKQQYKQALFLKLPQHVNLAQHLQIKKENTWQVNNAYSGITWTKNSTRLNSFINYSNDEWLEGFLANFNLKDGYLDSYFDLHAFDFDRKNEARIIFFKQLPNSLGINTYASYKYHEDEKHYNSAVQQSVSIPLTFNIHLQPMLQVYIPSGDFLKWIGSALDYINQNSLYLQVLAETGNNDKNRIDYQLSFQSPSLVLHIPLDLWIHIEQAMQKIDNAEVRVLSGSNDINPGIYYSYNPFTGIRWEGYLQWRW